LHCGGTDFHLRFLLGMPACTTTESLSALAAYEWKPLKISCGSRLRWSTGRVDAVLKEYSRYIELRLTVRDFTGVHFFPPTPVDEVFRIHMLDKEGFTAFCEAVCPFGTSFEHHSTAADMDAVVGEEKIDNVKVAYLVRFAELPPAGIWYFGPESSEGESPSSLASEPEGQSPGSPAGRSEGESLSSPGRQRQRYWTKSHPPQSTMPILVKAPTGRTYKLNVRREDKLKQVKAQLQRLSRIPTRKQGLIFEGKQLDDERVVSFYNIHEESSVHLVF
jgi:hypothetical protein